MTERPPRTAAQMFAARFGVSETYAERYVARFPNVGEFEVTDAQLDAMAALSDLEAANELHDIDVADAAAADDPEAALTEMLQAASDRRLIGKLGAHARWAKTPEEERAAQTQKARDAFEAKFEREVDPDGVLEPAERARRAEHARKAHFARMALKSSQARRKRKSRSR